jgi:replicative DNA helicase
MTSAWQQPTKEEVKATLADLRAGRSRDSVELRGHSVDTSTGASDLRKRDSVDSVEAWTPPAPLGRPGKLPAFPAGALPAWLASFVRWRWSVQRRPRPQPARRQPDRARDALIEARELAREAEEVQVPLPPRMLADDVTPEALVSLLAAYERMAILSPEGGVFQMMAGRYSQAGIGPPLDAYLKGHSGDQIRVDRKGRDPEFAQHPALTLGLAVQPDVLHSIADQPAFRGRGLLARFLYAVPESTVGRRQVGAPAIPENVRSHYHGETRALCASLAELAEPAGVAFGAKADRLLLDFEADLEPRLGEDGDLGHIADWGSKLAGAVVRIAGLLHLAEHLREGWARPVEDETVIGSIEIAEYLIQHALTVFDAMGADPALSDARYVLGHLERHPRECFTIRDLHVALPRGRFAKVANLSRPSRSSRCTATSARSPPRRPRDRAASHPRPTT